MPHTTNIGSGRDWLNTPTVATLYKDQNRPQTARRIVVLTAGELWLIPVGGAPADERQFGSVEIPAGQYDEQHDGIGASNTAVVIAQF